MQGILKVVSGLLVLTLFHLNEKAEMCIKESQVCPYVPMSNV